MKFSCIMSYKIIKIVSKYSVMKRALKLFSRTFTNRHESSFIESSIQALNNKYLWMKPFIAFSFIFFLALLNIPKVNAQRPDFEQRMERLNAQKIAFFTQKLQLTSEEAEKFWPVYNAYQKEKTENQKNKMKLQSKFRQDSNNLDDKELENMADEYINYIKKDANISTDYHQKFKNVLSINKVMRLYQAENQFKAMLLRQLRNEQQKKNKLKY